MAKFAQRIKEYCNPRKRAQKIAGKSPFNISDFPMSERARKEYYKTLAEYMELHNIKIES